MSAFEQLAQRWRTARIPVGSSVDEVDEYHADLVLADVWVAEGVIPFLASGVTAADVIGVASQLDKLRTKFQNYTTRLAPDSAQVSHYLEYLDLLIEVQSALEAVQRTRSDRDHELVKHWLNRMIGLRVWGPSVGHGSFVTIEFGETRVTSTGSIGGEFHLWIFGAQWQIRDANRTAATSDDERPVMQAGVNLLDGSKLRRFEFDRERMSMNLFFGHDVELAITPWGDPEMEEWYLWLDDGTVITAGPGDSITRQPASRP
jgi:hypothetical protein